MASRLPDIIPGPLMLKKGFAASARLSSDEEDEPDRSEDGGGINAASISDRGAAVAGRGAFMEDEEGQDGEADDLPPQIVADRSALTLQGDDDGLTAAQRDQERKRNGKRRPGDDEVSHKQRIEAFNAKLAKLTDINEMYV